MLTKVFPCGWPVRFEDIYDQSKIGKMETYTKIKGIKVKGEMDFPLSACPLHIQQFRCMFRLKHKANPCLPKKLSITNKAIKSHEDLINPVLTLCDVAYCLS